MAPPLAAEDPPELSPREFVDRLRASGLVEAPGFRAELELCREVAQSVEADDSSSEDGFRELPHRLDAGDLSQAGWGVVYTAEDEDVVHQRLGDLLARRRRQAGDLYQEVLCSPGQLARHFLWDQQEVAPGTVDPDRLPYYLLLVGGPERIPFDFQCQLSISHAVGRVCFDDAADYERYAEGIVAAETSVNPPRSIHLFSVENGDKTTRLLAEHLVRPLEERLGQASEFQEVVVARREHAYKRHLARLLADDEPPGLLLVSCHGKRFLADDVQRQRARQGALICQDWVPDRGPSTEQQYFYAGDLASDLRLEGLVAFLFACFGAGTPVEDNFPHETQEVTGNRPLRPGGLSFEPFVARLPQALLARGASAVVGHVDRGWTSSFCWRLGGRSQEAIGSLEDSLDQLLTGSRLGHALRPIYRRYTSLAADLVVMLERLRYGEEINEAQLANLWTAHNDARNFIILGDPAVRLPDWEYCQQKQWAKTDTVPDASDGSSSISTDATARSTNVRPSQVMSSVHDLEILVFAKGSPPALTYWLTSQKLALNQREFGPVQLRLEPQPYFEQFFSDVKSGLRVHSKAHQRLVDRGAHLAEELLPKDLMQTLWQHRKQVRTVRIQSQETWIPWELLKLQGRDESGRWQQGPFLCEAFALTRWRHEIPEQLDLPLGEMALIVSSAPELPAVVKEREALLSFDGTGRRVHRIPARRSKVLEQMAGGVFDGWHFTGHGITPPGDADHWAILLDDDPLTPASLHGEVRNLGRKHPLVFLNACHTGRGAMSLTGAGGWAAKLLEVGVGAFIGTSWPVTDRSAKIFAEEFYRRFFAGLPIGEAVRKARLEIRNRFPRDPSWLAYTVFAHPLARCAIATQTPENENVAIPRSVAAGPKISEAQTAKPLPAPSARLDHDGDHSKSTNAWRHRLERFRWSVSGLLVGLLAFIVLNGIRLPTRVQLILTVDQIAFTVGGEETGLILDASFELHHLRLSRFSRLDFHPSELRPAGSISSAEEKASHHVLPITERVILTARDAGSYVNLEPEEGSESKMLRSLGPLEAEPETRVVMQTGTASSGVLELRLRMTPAKSLDIPVEGAFQLQADFVEVTGAGLPAASDVSVFWRGRFRPSFVKVSSGVEGLALTASVPAPKDILLLNQELPITSVEFLRQGSVGKPLTTLRAAGQLRYPDHSWKSPIALRAEDFLAVEGLRAFRLRSLRADSASGHLQLLLDGKVDSVRVGPSGLGKEYGLSLLERLRGPMWAWLISGLAGCAVLAQGVGKLWTGRSQSP